MNTATTFQNILVIAAFAFALWFLIKLVFFKKKKQKKGCSGNDTCGCH